MQSHPEEAGVGLGQEWRTSCSTCGDIKRLLGNRHGNLDSWAPGPSPTGFYIAPPYFLYSLTGKGPGFFGSVALESKG